jgi:putative membrane protein
MKDRPPIRPFELDPASPTTVTEEVPADIALAEAQAPETVPLLAEGPRQRSWGGRLLGLFTLGVVGAGVVQAIDYVGSLLRTDPLLGVPFALFLAMALVAGSAFAAREIADMRRLSRRAHMRETANRLAASELHGEAEALLAPLEAEFGSRPALKANVEAFRAKRHDAMNDGEVLRLFERQVLGPVDKAAYRLVLESSRDVGLLTALSPLGLLDGVLVLWRTSILFRSIARLYGMAPGPLTTLALLKGSIRNAALAGLADVVTHAAVEHVGAGLLAMLSARAGQGAGNALLHARLGIEAMRQCRPLPFVAEEPPRLANVRKALLESLGENAAGKKKLR